MSLTVVTWKYKSEDGSRHYTSEHVNWLSENFRKHYHKSHRFVCITDDPDGLEVEHIPCPLSLPKNYRKLWLFSKEAAQVIKGRVFFTDLDTVFVDDVTKFLDIKEQLVLWSDPLSPQHKYITSQYLLTMGSRPDIWENFSEDKVDNKFVGSDQAWVNTYLSDEATFGSGIYLARYAKQLPDDAKIVQFSGQRKPWDTPSLKIWTWLEKYIG